MTEYSAQANPVELNALDLQAINEACAKYVSKQRMDPWAHTIADNPPNPTETFAIVELWNVLSHRIHQLNRRAGWWTNIKTGEPLARNFGEILMLCVSEVAEGLEASFTAEMDDKLPAYQGWWVELADLLIRAADADGSMAFSTYAGQWLHAYGKAIEDELSDVPSSCAEVNFGGDPTVEAAQLMIFLSRTMEAHRKGKPCGDHLAACILQVLLTAQVREKRFLTILCEKVAYNTIRVDHTIAARLAEGGKAY